MKDYPEIRPPFVQGILKDGEKFHPFKRNPETLVRRWAIPGQKGFEHRVGGLEKNHDGVLSNDPVNHATMVSERAEKVARIARDIPQLDILHGVGSNGPELRQQQGQQQKNGAKTAEFHNDFFSICAIIGWASYVGTRNGERSASSI